MNCALWANQKSQTVHSHYLFRINLKIQKMMRKKQSIWKKTGPNCLTTKSKRINWKPNSCVIRISKEKNTDFRAKLIHYMILVYQLFPFSNKWHLSFCRAELKTWEDKMMREGKEHLVRKIRFLTKNDEERKRRSKQKTE